MRFRLLGVLFALVVMSQALTACGGLISQALVGKPGPAYAPFFVLDESPVILDQFKGKNVIVLFWEYKCAQSHKTIDALNDYVRRYGVAKNVVGLAVSIDKRENIERIRNRIVASQLYSITHVFSGNDIYDEAKVAFGVDTIPSVFVLDTRGQVTAAGTSMGVVEQVLGG